MQALLAILAAVLAGGTLGGGSSGDNGPNTAATDSGGDDGSSASATLAALSSPETAFFAEDGQLVLEAESAAASGDWQQRMVDGEQVMLWDADANSYNRVQDDQALSFEFVTDEAGAYSISIHGARVASAMDPGDVRNDTGNDAYVRLTNLETGEEVVEATKLFTSLGDADEDLRWGTTFDANHVKSPAEADLQAGTAYRLELIGRSDGHAIDRVTLAKGGHLRDADLAESGLFLAATDSETLSALPDEDDDAIGLLL